ncbi:MAG: acetolactate synthase small subunit [Candidatus Bathyarchaeota archaeon]|nr:acetolactate synthase small subunit [Candidatus Bathyarchaeota archaeon]MCX8176727.1 acetolactate synthase small subunit [Candidatus Bathyarchaeota archaeon]MDW8193255.1 acetolactate synthase small subunit [Nitrososphaerota archaeon]
MGEVRTHIISALVENRPGVLYSVANMFRRRNFNIDSITVGAVNGDLARMTITIKGDEKTVEQLVKQLRKLIDVVKVSILNPASAVSRELALVKINAPEARIRADVLHYVDIFRGHVVDASPETLIVEITGGPDKIDAFIELMKVFGIKELVRTGIAALSRGSKSIDVAFNTEEGET